MPTVRDALAAYADRLAGAGVDSPRLSAEVLLAHALGGERILLLTEARRALTPAELVRVEHLIARREAGEPVAYLTGRKEFYGLDFEVTPATLIPRPETEHLVEEAERLFDASAPLRFADFGTGSGALAVTLAVRFPQATGLALDRSAEALEVARRNGARHGVDGRIRFACASFLEPLKPSLEASGLDLIVANPPYVSEAEYAGLSREVAAHEPASALVSGPDGLDHIRGLLPVAAQALRPGGVLLLEMGCGQGPSVLALAAAPGSGFTGGVIISDLAGLDRVVRAQRCG